MKGNVSVPQLWQWNPLWQEGFESGLRGFLPAFISIFFTALLASHCAMKSVTPRSTVRRAAHHSALPGSPCAAPFPKTGTVCIPCVQRRTRSACGATLLGCRVISWLGNPKDVFIQSYVELPTDIAVIFVNFCLLHIWIAAMKFILHFTEELIWIMLCLGMLSVFSWSFHNWKTSTFQYIVICYKIET